MIYHIAERQRWQAAELAGGAENYRPAGYTAEGFIHCSTSAQLLEVANRLFRGRNDLLLLSIDDAQLHTQLVYENLEGGDEQYPHVYGTFNADAVLRTDALVPSINGRFNRLPFT